MTQWSSMRSRVRSVIRDDVVTYNVDDPTLLAYVNYAIDWVSMRHPDQKSASVTLTNRVGTLPSDFLQPITVMTTTKELDRSEGYFPSSDEYSLASSTSIKVGDSDLTSVTIIYHSMYSQIVLDTDVIPVPRAVEEAVFAYVCSRGLFQLASDSGDISQWDTRTDSGNPEHNPVLSMAKEYEELANRILMRPVTL